MSDYQANLEAAMRGLDAQDASLRTAIELVGLEVQRQSATLTNVVSRMDADRQESDKKFQRLVELMTAEKSSTSTRFDEIVKATTNLHNSVQGLTNAMAASTAVPASPTAPTMRTSARGSGGGAAAAASSSGTRGEMLIDNRGLGRPPICDPIKPTMTFVHWRNKVTSWVNAVHNDIRDVIAIACTFGPKRITIDDLEIAMPLIEVETLKFWDIQLGATLDGLTQNEAYDLVLAAGGSGFEAMRRLQRRFDPANAIQKSNLLDRITQVVPVSQDDLLAEVEKWDQKVREYNASSKDPISDEMKMVYLRNMTVGKLKEHLNLTWDNYKTYDGLREFLESYLLQHVASYTKDSGATPMDLSPFQQQQQPVTFTGTCNHCKAVGHKKADCWIYQKEMAAKGGGKGKDGKKGGKGNGKGKDGKGKGKGKDKGGGKGKGKMNALAETAAAAAATTSTNDAWEGEWSQDGWWPTEQNMFFCETLPMSSKSRPIRWSAPQIDADGWRKIYAMVDSGCGRSAGPVKFASNLKVESSEDSRAGRCFATANGQVVKATGQRRLTSWIGDEKITMTFEVCDIDKYLLSLFEMTKKKMKFWFDEHQGVLILPSGTEIQLLIRSNVYWLPMWLPPGTLVGDDEADDDKMEVNVVTEAEKMKTLAAATIEEAPGFDYWKRAANHQQLATLRATSSAGFQRQ